MADGYAQARGSVALVNLHISCGLGNAMGMLYNAFRAGTPLVLTAGQQDQRFLHSDPILWGDMVSVTRPWTKWSTEVRTARELPRILSPGNPAGPDSSHRSRVSVFTSRRSDGTASRSRTRTAGKSPGIARLATSRSHSLCRGATCRSPKSGHRIGKQTVENPRDPGRLCDRRATGSPCVSRAILQPWPVQFSRGSPPGRWLATLLGAGHPPLSWAVRCPFGCRGKAL